MIKTLFSNNSLQGASSWRSYSSDSLVAYYGGWVIDVMLCLQVFLLGVRTRELGGAGYPRHHVIVIELVDQTYFVLFLDRGEE